MAPWQSAAAASLVWCHVCLHGIVCKQQPSLHNALSASRRGHTCSVLGAGSEEPAGLCTASSRPRCIHHPGRPAGMTRCSCPRMRPGPLASDRQRFLFLSHPLDWPSPAARPWLARATPLKRAPLGAMYPAALPGTITARQRAPSGRSTPCYSTPISTCHAMPCHAGAAGPSHA